MSRELFRDREHLVRLALVLIAGIALFLVAGAALRPKGFGTYGHYRPQALAANRARPVSFAGRAACAECHDDVVQLRAGSRHERIGCEACHEALAAHAADPGSTTPRRPDARVLCVRCHEANVTRPASFPQVDPVEHAGDSACTECHRPHHPEVE